MVDGGEGDEGVNNRSPAHPGTPGVLLKRWILQIGAKCTKWSMGGEGDEGVNNRRHAWFGTPGVLLKRWLLQIGAKCTTGGWYFIDPTHTAHDPRALSGDTVEVSRGCSGGSQGRSAPSRADPGIPQAAGKLVKASAR